MLFRLETKRFFQEKLKPKRKRRQVFFFNQVWPEEERELKTYTFLETFVSDFFSFLFFRVPSGRRIKTGCRRSHHLHLMMADWPLLDEIKKKKLPSRASQINDVLHSWIPFIIFVFFFFCRFLGLFFRWTTVSLSCAGMRTSLYPAVEFAAAPPQSRRPAGTGQEPAVSVRHLRQRIRHRVLTPHPHGQGNQINPQQN